MRKLLVTGANRGIGLALVREALKTGDRVFAACRNPSRAQALHDLGDAHRELTVLKLDLMDAAGYDAAYARVEELEGSLDVLVNNAGIYTANPEVAPKQSHESIRHYNHESAEAMFRVNSIAPLAVTRVFLPLLARGTHPRIAFLSSEMGSIARKQPDEIEYNYSASKAALNMLVRVLALEISPQIIAVALCPGWVATDMGTSAAPLQPDPVAHELWRVIHGLQTSDAGTFLDWQGDTIAW